MQENSTKESEDTAKKNDEILSPEQAREWLNEFLEEQQKENE